MLRERSYIVWIPAELINAHLAAPANSLVQPIHWLPVMDAGSLSITDPHHTELGQAAPPRPLRLAEPCDPGRRH